MACSICCEKFTQVARRRVQCPYCNYTACVGCTKNYVLSLSKDPCCMNCGTMWSIDMVRDFFDKTFVKKQLKQHKTNLLFEKEIALLPSTQPFVHKTILVATLREDFNELRRQRQEIQRQMDDIAASITNIDDEIQRGIILKNNDDGNRFVRACPNSICKGYLDSTWVCGLCKSSYCNKCHQQHHTGHNCNEDDVATAMLLVNNTKPCPTCASLIFKIDGCDQMFCTICHTAFSWRTREVENKRIHNPHYYDWVRQNNNGDVPREQNDDPCQNHTMMRFMHVIDLINASPEMKSYKDMIIKVYRLLSYIKYVELPKHELEHNVNHNLQLRIDYMMNKVDTTTFKKKLYQHGLDQEKKEFFRQVLNMFFNVGYDTFQEFIQTPSQIEMLRNQLLELIDYTNAICMTMSRRYDCVSYYIVKPQFQIVKRKAEV